MDYPTIDISATGKRIGSLIKAKGCTLKDLQSYLGFSSPQAIYKWMWGKSMPSVDNLFALSVLLNTPIDEILVGKKQVKAQRYTALKSTPRMSGKSISYHFVALIAA
jgi:transcriptional regulator with XRE-family HTH domain